MSLDIILSTAAVTLLIVWPAVFLLVLSDKLRSRKPFFYEGHDEDDEKEDISTEIIVKPWWSHLATGLILVVFLPAMFLMALYIYAPGAFAVSVWNRGRKIRARLSKKGP